MEFRLLGPLEVRSPDGDPMPIRGRHHPKILAALAVDAGQIVAVDRLVASLWDGEPPDTATKQIQNAVGGLRRQLGASGTLLETAGHGYRLAVPESSVDWLRFRAGCALAQRHRRDGDPDAALTAIRDALAEWRGPALAGLTGPLAAGIAARLDNNRISAVEDRLELELAVDDTTEADELWPLLDEHPLRQRFAGLLMRTLARQGRSPEALRVFAQLRRRLSEELGVDPDPRLVELHTEILRQTDGAVVVPEPVSVSAPLTRLPADVDEFTGRDRLLAALDTERSASAGAPVVVVSGIGGVGKTAAILHWAHRADTVAAFPDGRLFVDLQGFTDNPPVTATDAVTNLLRQLGVPGRQVPSDLDEARALARQLLEQRRCLVILDNAADAAQVRPLLLCRRPGLTVVTSRNRLSALTAAAGARRVELGGLPESDSLTLLRRLLGESVVNGSPEAAERLVELCARLPLALRVATAAFNDTHRHTRLADFVEQLGRDRLGTLDLDDADTAVATVLARSTKRLDPELLQAFWLLGAHPGPRIDLAAAAALWDVSEVVARRSLRRLAAVHLVEETDTERFGMHDLLREHAVESAQRNGVPSEAARRRLLRHYAAVLADREVDPVWVNAELPALLACLRLPPSPALLDYALKLGDTLADISRHRESELTFETALTLAPDGTREHFEALRGHGYTSVHSGHPLAESHMRQALAGFRKLGDKPGAVTTLRNLGESARARSDLGAAAAYNREALRLAVECGDQVREAHALTGVSLDQSMGHDIGAAQRSAAEAIRIGEELGDLRTLSMAHSTAGFVAWSSRDYGAATLHYAAALPLCHAVGDREGISGCTLGMGRIAYENGDLATAEAQYRLTVAIARDTGETHTQAIALHELARLLADRGDHGECRDSLNVARELSRAAGDEAGIGFTSKAIAGSLMAEGLLVEAIAEYRLACESLSDAKNYPTGAAEARRGLGDAYARLGRGAEAEARWRDALRFLDGLDSPRANQLREELTANLAAGTTPRPGGTGLTARRAAPRRRPGWHRHRRTADAEPPGGSAGTYVHSCSRVSAGVRFHSCSRTPDGNRPHSWSRAGLAVKVFVSAFIFAPRLSDAGVRNLRKPNPSPSRSRHVPVTNAVGAETRRGRASS